MEPVCLCLKENMLCHVQRAIPFCSVLVLYHAYHPRLTPYNQWHIFGSGSGPLTKLNFIASILAMQYIPF